LDGSGHWLGLVELVLVFAIVLGWGLNELRQLRRHRDADARAGRGQADDDLDAGAEDRIGPDDEPR